MRRVLSLSQSSIPKVAGGEFKGELDGGETADTHTPSDTTDVADNQSSDNLSSADVEDSDADEPAISYEERTEMLKKATEVDESYLEGPVVQFCLYAGLDNLLPDFDFIIIDDDRVIIRTKLGKTRKIKGFALI